MLFGVAVVTLEELEELEADEEPELLGDATGDDVDAAGAGDACMLPSGTEGFVPPSLMPIHIGQDRAPRPSLDAAELLPSNREAHRVVIVTRRAVREAAVALLHAGSTGPSGRAARV